MAALLFISYAHDDGYWVKRLRNHLAVLRQEGIVEDWHDRQIEPGANWERAIAAELDRADVIIALVSPSFLASEYISGVEMSRALDRHERGDASVVPVILRPVDWERTPLGRLQALPRDAKPIISHRNRDQALRDVARGLRRLMARQKEQGAVAPMADRRPANHVYFLNHTSFLRPQKQEDFRSRTGVPVAHYDIRVIVDAEDEGALEQIERVEYNLHEAYPEPIRVRTQRDRPDHFLLKELANGEYLLRAKVYVSGQRDPVELQRYITLWQSGPELP